MITLRRVLGLCTCCVALAGCGGDESEPCSTSDADGDGLDGCSEESLGTNPDNPDSDGDGLDDSAEGTEGTDPNNPDTDDDSFDDLAEIECVSDPLDELEGCYACGWPHNDPGNLVSTGNAAGDVIANLELVDQCREEVPLWDFAGEYHILFITASW